MVDAPQNATEETEHAPGIKSRGSKPAKEQAEVVLIAGLHHARGVASGRHGLLDETGEEIDSGGWCGRIGIGHRLMRRGQSAAGQFVEAHRNSLAQVHRGLARVGGDFDEHVAVRQIVAGEAVFLGAENQGDAAAAVELLRQGRGRVWQEDDRLFWFAVRECAGARNEGTGCNCQGQSLRLLCVLE